MVKLNLKNKNFVILIFFCMMFLCLSPLNMVLGAENELGQLEYQDNKNDVYYLDSEENFYVSVKSYPGIDILKTEREGDVFTIELQDKVLREGGDVVFTLVVDLEGGRNVEYHETNKRADLIIGSDSSEDSVAGGNMINHTNYYGDDVAVISYSTDEKIITFTLNSSFSENKLGDTSSYYVYSTFNPNDSLISYLDYCPDAYGDYSPGRLRTIALTIFVGIGVVAVLLKLLVSSDSIFDSLNVKLAEGRFSTKLLEIKSKFKKEILPEMHENMQTMNNGTYQDNIEEKNQLMEQSISQIGIDQSENATKFAFKKFHVEEKKELGSTEMKIMLEGGQQIVKKIDQLWDTLSTPVRLSIRNKVLGLYLFSSLDMYKDFLASRWLIGKKYILLKRYSEASAILQDIIMKSAGNANLQKINDEIKNDLLKINEKTDINRVNEILSDGREMRNIVNFIQKIEGGQPVDDKWIRSIIKLIQSLKTDMPDITEFDRFSDEDIETSKIINQLFSPLMEHEEFKEILDFNEISGVILNSRSLFRKKQDEDAYKQWNNAFTMSKNVKHSQLFSEILNDINSEFF